MTEPGVAVHEEGRALATLDRIASRLKTYFAAIAIVGASVGGATSWIVYTSTASVRSEVASVKAMVESRAHADSIRFERVLEVVELSVVAIVEKEGSPEQQAALDKLRGKRSYIR